MVHGLGRRPGGVDEEHEGRGLAGGLGEGVVEDEAEHAALAMAHIVDAHRDLVGLALAVPFQRYEALGGQLVLGGRGMVPAEGSRLGLGNCGLGGGVQVGDGIRSEVRAARARVLEDAEVPGRC